MDDYVAQGIADSQRYSQTAWALLEPQFEIVRQGPGPEPTYSVSELLSDTGVSIIDQASASAEAVTFAAVHDRYQQLVLDVADTAAKFGVPLPADVAEIVTTTRRQADQSSSP